MGALDNIKQIQVIVGVTPDGNWGPLSQMALYNLSTTQTPAASAGIKAIQAILGVAQDGLWGPESQSALDGLVLQLRQWPYTFRVDGDDLVVDDIVITCFGGNGDGTNSDPQDNGISASQIDTVNNSILAVALAIDSRLFSGMYVRDPEGYAALLGAPFPLMPWGTQVAVTINGKTYTPPDGLQDLGPGYGASSPGEPHALDLSVPAAQIFQPLVALHDLSKNFGERGSFRVLGAAKLAS